MDSATIAAVLIIGGVGLLYYAIWSPSGVLAKNPISSGTFGGFQVSGNSQTPPTNTTGDNTGGPNLKGRALARFNAGVAPPYPSIGNFTYEQQRQAFIDAIAHQEGGYNSVNPKSGAIGRYQILPAEWHAWAKKYLGNANAAPTPANQDAVMRGRVDDYYRSFSSKYATGALNANVSIWARIAVAWSRGPKAGNVNDWHQWSRHGYLYATNAMWNMEHNLGLTIS